MKHYEGGIVVERRRFNFHVEFLQACSRLFMIALTAVKISCTELEG